MRRHVSLALLAPLVLALLACSDAAAPDREGGVAYDLLFDGADAAGVVRLYRVRIDPTPAGGLAAAAPELVRGGLAGRAPAARPDGRAIVYESIDTEAEAARLMLVADGADPVPLEDWAHTASRRPTWSPDGRRVAFAGARDGGFPDIHVGTLAGGRLTSVTNLTRTAPGGSGTDYTPAWSPDGALIAFTGYRPYPAIWVMAPDGGAARRVTDQGGQHSDYLPSWSPDGRWIAFQRNSPDPTRIGIVSADGGAARFLDLPGVAGAPAWSPDGRYLAFTGERGGERDVYVVTPEGAEVLRVARAGADFFPAWIRRAADR